MQSSKASVYSRSVLLLWSSGVTTLQDNGSLNLKASIQIMRGNKQWISEEREREGKAARNKANLVQTASAVTYYHHYQIFNHTHTARPAPQAISFPSIVLSCLFTRSSLSHSFRRARIYWLYLSAICPQLSIIFQKLISATKNFY